MAELNVEELSFSWPRLRGKSRKTLEAISLSLKPGELVGLLGPNGSGKSTFLKNLLGFLKPAGGRVLFAEAPGLPGKELSPAERALRFSLTPQFSGLKASFTVTELVLMGRLPRLKDRWSGYSAEDRRKAAEVMEILGIASMAERNALTLSGGELQKVVIARCLAQEGDILLLDEATSGLDLNHSVEIMELMRRKADDEGTIILAALHDLNLASQYCDRLLVLKDGRVRFEGTPQEVLLESVVEEIYGIRAVIRRDENGRPVVLPKRAAERPALPQKADPRVAGAQDEPTQEEETRYVR
ncbi:MAG: ABC transporter ATP-binding protein [Treponema sp.]|jgi:iron complex transport system ATP-binding protein|nr:ABC transporter ATP-binding protein [Treponema sp.]